MFHAKLSVVSRWLALVAAAGVVAGCSTTKVDETANWSPNRIYSEAKDEKAAAAWANTVAAHNSA